MSAPIHSVWTDSYNLHWLRQHAMAAFRIDYQGESHQDDEIAIYADQPDGMNTRIKAVRNLDRKIIFKALISWR